MKTKTSVTVRFDPALHTEMKSTSDSTRIPISTIVREGTALYLKLIKGKSPLEQRKLVRDEYMMLAIDLMIAKNFPDARQELMAEADRRAEQFNAAA